MAKIELTDICMLYEQISDKHSPLICWIEMDRLRLVAIIWKHAVYYPIEWYQKSLYVPKRC